MAALPRIQRELRARSGSDRRVRAAQIIRQLKEFPALAYRPAPTADLFHKCPHKIRWLLGGNRCLGPRTVIDSPDGQILVSEIRGDHRVWAWDGEQVVKATAREPFIKGTEPTRRVTLSNGRHFDCSGAHQVLIDGEYRHIYELTVGAVLDSPYGDKPRITSIEYGGLQDIYDFEVPRHHCYVTSGVVHHNSGKSRSAAQEVFWFATGTHPYRKIRTPNVGWYSTVTWEMVGTVLWATLEPLLEGWEWRVPSWVNRGKRIPNAVEIKVKGGWSRILMKSYEQGREAYQGTERRYICNDEQFPEEIMQEQLTRIGPGDALDFWAPLTPIVPQAWLEEKLTIEPPENWGIFELGLDENRISQGGVIPDNRIDAAIDSWPEEMRATRRSGKWASFIGAVYKTFLRETHVVEPEEEEKIIKFLAPGKVHGSMVSCGGIDFGGANPFVYLIVMKLPDDEWYVLDEYVWDYQTNGIRLLRDHAIEIQVRNEKWNTWPRNIWADHDLADRYELEAGGIATYPADKGASKSTLAETGVKAASHKRQLIETLQTLFSVQRVTGRPRLRIASRCKILIREIISNRWATGTDNRNAADLPIKKDDHCVDACQYAIHSERGSDRKAPFVIDTTGKLGSDVDDMLENLRW